jgi:hypothetical protein
VKGHGGALFLYGRDLALPSAQARVAQPHGASLPHSPRPRSTRATSSLCSATAVSSGVWPESSVTAGSTNGRPAGPAPCIGRLNSRGVLLPGFTTLMGNWLHKQGKLAFQAQPAA